MRWCTIILTINLLTGAGMAAAKTTTRPTTMVAGNRCVTPDCHPGVKKYNVVHAPVAMDSCDACHETLNVAAHTFKLTRAKAELCTYCHEFSVKGYPVVHKPVSEGECLGCHDPHGGRTTSLTRENSTAELCGRCHESITRGKKVLHTPVAQGACDSCHSPHASRFAKLLDRVGTDLCLTCHIDVEAQLAASTLRHKALESGCEKCHDAHGSAHAKATTQPIVEQCGGCHAQVVETALMAGDKHSVALHGKACITCHFPHAARQPKLMKDTELVVCMDCHAEKVKNGPAAVPEVFDAKMIKHQPIRDGECSGCHAPHGGQRAMLLKQTYSLSNYQRFVQQDFQLCFTCHDVRMVQLSETDRLTAFRNGTKNLHFVHVRDPAQGRGCAICHTVHAAANDRLVRDRIPLKKWQMPVGFSRTPTGGACRPGCHVAYGYDRDHPVATTMASATTRPIAPTTQAVEGAIRKIEFTAVDRQGREVHVPDPKKTTILALMRSGADDKVSRELINRVRTIQATDMGAQRLLIQSRAATQPSTRQTMGTGEWIVIDDPEQMLSRLMEVYSWPLVVVVSSDGSEIARVDGTSTVLADRLAPYLKNPVPATLPTKSVSTESASRTARLVRLAESLLDESKPDQAVALIEEARRMEPESVDVRLLRIRAELMRHNSSAAMDALDEIPVDRLPVAKRMVLRCQILMQQNHLEEAKRALLELQTNGDKSRRVHELLGEIYQQQKNWSAAAEEFKAAVHASQD